VVGLVVEKLVVALVGGWNGGEREGEKNCRNGGRGAGFWSILDLLFFLPHAMKCSPIYRRWKKNILSLMVPNHGLWFGW
jgi:hypothetical protein